ncbi:DUF6492 family protein [Agrococcus sp. TF02-05]|uniref:DUF6492 family protein n=1 Tax=Agrococcus sp. TF02-05 TaxID=2815211 RepID=UPI001AA15A79|nr:DUF6492 family protein [Agrococcus sp. TF02-05]MBO1769109.1 hypothetical protein [Agrococcus sp. TF02-05]
MASRHPSLEIVTPSYAPDFELCRDLIASVSRFAPAGTTHRVIVPGRDRALFEQLQGGPVVVEDARDLLPSGMLRLPLVNAWLQIRRPWPPVRGWIAQQVVKLAAAARSDAEYVLLVDSDVAFIRRFSVLDYTDADSLPLYRLDGAVHKGMSRHLVWHDAARELLGLPPHVGDAPRPDYICCPCLWKPDVVRTMLAVVQERCGLPWQVAVGRRLQFSEMVLYGVFVDEMLAQHTRVGRRSDMKCANHYLEEPLDDAGFDRLLRDARPTDVAVMVSAKSGTALATRRAALARLRHEG